MKKTILFTIVTLFTGQLAHTNQAIPITIKGSYNPTEKMAIVGNQTYIGIVEYSQATTPPNLSNPMLVAFATIPTPGYKKSSKPLLGGKKPTTTLYGIPVKGNKIAINPMMSALPFASEIKSITPEPTGYYWPDSDMAQLNNGTIYVHIIQHSQATTPPNVGDPDYTLIGTIPNPKITVQTLLGGQTQKTTLWGITLQKTLEEQAKPQAMLKVARVKQAKEIKITGNTGEKGQYNKQNQTAWLQTSSGKKYYSQVVEYSQPVTPPNVGNPKMVAFATMPNPNYKEQPKGFVGGPMKNIVLYGIPQDTTQATATLKKVAAIQIPQQPTKQFGQRSARRFGHNL